MPLLINQRCLLLSLSFFYLNSVNAESLETAWLSALHDNHSIKAAQATASASEQQLQAAQSQRLPSLNVSGGYSQFSAPLAARTDIAGQAYQFNTAPAGSSKVQAIASVPLFTSGRISHNIDAAEASLQASQANEASTISAIKLQIAESYIAVLRAQSAEQVARQHLSSLTTHAQEVAQRYEQGLVAKNDALAANVARLNAEQTLMQVSNQLDYAKSHYNQLLNRPLSAQVTLENLKPQLPTGTLENLTQSALAGRFELQVLAGEMASLSQQSGSVKAELLPQVALNSGYVYQENRYQANQGLWLAGVDVQWKLDASVSHKGDALSKQLAALKEQREDLANQISLQVRQIWLDIQESQQRIKVTEQAIAQAEENYRISNERYQQGLITHSELLQAEDLKTNSLDNHNNAHYDYSLAVLRLRRAVEML